MLAQIRAFSNTIFAKGILVLLLLALVGFGVQGVSRMGNVKDTVVEAGGRSVSSAKFRQFFDTYHKQIDQQQGQPVPSDALFKANIDGRLAEEVAVEESVAELLNREGIRPSDRLIAERVRDHIADGSLGGITMYDSTRMSLGLIQTETNVIWELAIHDCALMLYWFDEMPTEVSCTGVVVHPSEVTAAAHLSCTFASGLFAHVGVSWLSPVKKRSIVLTGNERMLVFDDIEPTEKIRVYDSRASVQMDEGQRKIQYRMGDIRIPHVLQLEALANQLSEISVCLDGRGTPRSDAEFALRLSLILEAADQSMAHGGSPQSVQP